MGNQCCQGRNKAPNVVMGNDEALKKSLETNRSISTRNT